MAAALMFQGTGSDVGKTVLVAGLCRAARNRGLRVRPFKPQNMSNNAAVARMANGDEGEIGRAQWLQAFACGCNPTVDMNPVLLKPQSEIGSQVIVQGRVRGTAKGRDYQAWKPKLLDAVLSSYSKLAKESDLVLVEGAGSPAEVNLRPSDIANMGFARAANVPVVLVGDIDRGGIIASVVGTHTVLDPEDRRMIAGTIVNKFRGDVSLFDDGLRIIEDHTGWRNYGVVTWLASASDLPAEDSVALEAMTQTSRHGALKIAVPVLPRIANFDDLDPLRAEPDVELRLVRGSEEFPADADVVLIPGSKATLADLRAMRERGWDQTIQGIVAHGGHVVGICGGYQMLGRTVRDPDGVEGGGEEVGLGLLDVDTLLTPDKTVRSVRARSMSDELIEAYEIHVGETEGSDNVRPFATIKGRSEGATSADGRVEGTYLHGAFTSGTFRRAWLRRFGLRSSGVNHAERVDAVLDRIAAELEQLLDIDGLLETARRGVDGR